MDALDPDRLVAEASINRVRLAGTIARDLLSAAALAALAAEHGLRPDGPVRSYLDGRLAGGDPRAGAVAAEYGRRLGALLAVLRSGDRAARPDWDHPSWWDRWAATTTVWLGGGLAGGPFGQLVAARAEAAAAEPAEAAVTGPAGGPGGVGAGAGPAGCRVVVAPEPGLLPLLGAARVRDPAVVLDFGHTLVKRALVRPGGLVPLAPVPAPAEDATGAQVAASVAATLTAARAAAGDPPGPVVAAMAAYLIDGRPVRTALGTYTRLADVTGDLPGWLADRVGAEVVLLHDGTAAAKAVPPDPHAVVVLLGTSLGVGYPA